MAGCGAGRCEPRAPPSRCAARTTTGTEEREDEDPDPPDRHHPRPATPYINAVRSARLLGNAVLLTQNGYGHLSFHNPSARIDRVQFALFGPADRTAKRHRLPVREEALRSRLGLTDAIAVQVRLGLATEEQLSKAGA